MTRREALGLVALGLVLRVLFFQGLVGSDDIASLDQAHRIAEGHPLASDTASCGRSHAARQPAPGEAP